MEKKGTVFAVAVAAYRAMPCEPTMRRPGCVVLKRVENTGALIIMDMRSRVSFPIGPGSRNEVSL